MSIHSLQNKTIRPGSFVGYSYYHSRPAAPAPKKSAKPKKTYSTKLLSFGLLVILGFAVYSWLPSAKPASHSLVSPPQTVQAPAVTKPNVCSGNSGQLIKVSLKARHLWACSDSKLAYESAVITGNQNHADTLTPVGTYKIQSKQTNLALSGSDSTGSWNDPVYYWLPFLTNQYGNYGFHDATWRDNSAFGTVDPNSANASHGCVELPLGTAKWLYSWAAVDTTVSITS